MLKVKVNSNNEYMLELADNVKVNQQDMKVDIVKISPRSWHILWKNKGYNVEIIDGAKPKEKSVVINGNVYPCHVYDKNDILLEQMGFKVEEGEVAEDVKAPMPGLVLKTLVEIGQEVEKDTPLLILEAMKMENVIKAVGKGVVSGVKVLEREAVEKNQILITFN